MLADNDLVRTTLINGDPELCKAFLFEAAISWAKEGHQVHYFASKQLDSLPPAFHDRSEPSADSLKLMTFIYTASYEDLVSQLVKLQTFQKPPSVLLLDDLDVFVDYPGIRHSSRELHAARCCSVLLNAAQSCARVAASTASRPVRVCAVSFTDEPQRVATYSKYFDDRWFVGAESAEEDSEVGRRVWMKRRGERGQRALEFARLDDAVLVLRRMLSDEDGGGTEGSWFC